MNWSQQWNFQWTSYDRDYLHRSSSRFSLFSLLSPLCSSLRRLNSFSGAGISHSSKERMLIRWSFHLSNLLDISHFKNESPMKSFNGILILLQEFPTNALIKTLLSDASNLLSTCRFIFSSWCSQIGL